MRARCGHAALIGLCSVLAGCSGRALPSDEDVYHEASLRPGSVPAESDAERQLLTRLPSLAANEPVQLGDQIYLPLDSYTSASGRRCTPVRVRSGGGERTRVACESDDAWVFVPDVFGGDDPFAGTAGAP